MCNRNCDKLCPNLIFSTSIAVVTVDGTDTLVITVPAGYYNNCRKLCLVLTQTIPTTATIDMPVAITIEGSTDGATYPVVNCSCVPITARNIITRYKYKLKVVTNNTSGVFKVYNLPCGINSTVLDALGT
jgi:hypothetical protein